MDILFFGYSWWEGFRLDPYQQSILDTLVKQGHRVHVVIGNRFAKRDGIFGFSGDPEKFVRYINDNGIQLVLCKNNAGNYSEIRERVSCPFVSWASDEFSHIFRPDGEGVEGLVRFFGDRMHFFVTSTECDALYRQLFPDRKDQIHFVAHCTSPEKFRAKPMTQTIDVSFVGSSLDIDFVYRLLAAYARPSEADGVVYRAILEAIESLRQDYHHDFEQTIDRLGLRAALTSRGMSGARFRMLCTNVISNNDRFQLLAAVQEFRTAIFGNTTWIDSLNFTTALCREYRPWAPVRSFDDLVDVYQSSKISISIPQHQVGAAIQYRVIDVMASDALLFTKFSEESDLFRVFGKDCPVPMYRSPAHLRELTDYYLRNETERRALVERCQALVSEKFSFEYRLREIFRIANVPFGTEGPGREIRPPIQSFFSKKELLSQWLKERFNRLPVKLQNLVRRMVQRRRMA